MSGNQLPPQDGQYGVLGFPLAQSLSPALHAWAFARLGRDASYAVWETPPDALPAFMRRFRETPLAGASVTIPHKLAVMPFLDAVTETARRIGAVNTLYWNGNVLTGHNTDMEGFLAPLAGLPIPEAALVLGAGGAARAALAALARLGIPLLRLAARDRAKADALAEEFTPAFAHTETVALADRGHLLPAAQRLWVINTTPLGMHGKAEGLSPLDERDFAAAPDPTFCLAYDLVYNPLRTPFLTLAEQAGWRCRDGLGMFLGQADGQCRLWTGLPMPDPADARALVAGLLGQNM